LRKAKTTSEFGRGGELNTIVGKSSSITGNIKVQNSLRIDGQVNGNISATETVIIGKDGSVNGNVKAKHVLLAGKVSGNISTSGKVFLETTASISGDITAVQLVVDEGAVFDGKCKMSNNSTEIKNSQNSTE